ncbi:gamma-glutamylcyclotransferase [Ferruginibacter yonginensis]|uniref:Gamma-glutamylcyclotransferase n=1 Tax=Ferruginibacter yonginensis TaxID=1310416 RepID=A0ABV8QT12_9BACT
MNNNSYNLFVYGSLRSGFRNPAYQYITQFFKCMGEGMVKGQFFDKGTHPVAIHTTDDHFILGELYTLNNPDDFSWAFEQLDDYEGVHVEPGETPLYKRALVTVYQNDQQITAWIYWYNGDITGLPAIETGDVMKYLQQKNQP